MTHTSVVEVRADLPTLVVCKTMGVSTSVGREEVCKAGRGECR